MNNKDIEEDIKQLEEFIGLFYEFPNPTSVSIRDYEVQAIENILADRERLKAKANKYDRLVEKIKEALGFIKTGKDTNSKVKTECLENILKLIEEE